MCRAFGHSTPPRGRPPSMCSRPQAQVPPPDEGSESAVAWLGAWPLAPRCAERPSVEVPSAERMSAAALPTPPRWGAGTALLLYRWPPRATSRRPCRTPRRLRRTRRAPSAKSSEPVGESPQPASSFSIRCRRVASVRPAALQAGTTKCLKTRRRVLPIAPTLSQRSRGAGTSRRAVRGARPDLDSARSCQ
jgi:hypothetical protein